MPADTAERGRAERDENEVAGVGGDAREHAEPDDDERQHGLGRDGHEPSDERADQPGRLGQANADHHDEDDRERLMVPQRNKGCVLLSGARTLSTIDASRIRAPVQPGSREVFMATVPTRSDDAHARSAIAVAADTVSY